MNEITKQHLKIARTLINATLDGDAKGTYTAADTEMMIRGALGDIGYALAVASGVEPSTGAQVDVTRAVEAAVQIVVEVETKRKVAA